MDARFVDRSIGVCAKVDVRFGGAVARKVSGAKKLELAPSADSVPVFLGNLSNLLAITAKTLHNRDERRYLRALICDPI